MQTVARDSWLDRAVASKLQEPHQGDPRPRYVDGLTTLPLFNRSLDDLQQGLPQVQGSPGRARACVAVTRQLRVLRPRPTTNDSYVWPTWRC